jgi:hypothetical protein
MGGELLRRQVFSNEYRSSVLIPARVDVTPYFIYISANKPTAVLTAVDS